MYHCRRGNSIGGSKYDYRVEIRCANQIVQLSEVPVPRYHQKTFYSTLSIEPLSTHTVATSIIVMTYYCLFEHALENSAITIISSIKSACWSSV